MRPQSLNPLTFPRKSTPPTLTHSIRLSSAKSRMIGFSSVTVFLRSSLTENPRFTRINNSTLLFLLKLSFRCSYSYFNVENINTCFGVIIISTRKAHDNFAWILRRSSPQEISFISIPAGQSSSNNRLDRARPILNLNSTNKQRSHVLIQFLWSQEVDVTMATIIALPWLTPAT